MVSAPDLNTLLGESAWRIAGFGTSAWIGEAGGEVQKDSTEFSFLPTDSVVGYLHRNQNPVVSKAN